MVSPHIHSDSTSVAGRATRAAIVGLLVSLVALVVGSTPVSAHTSFIGSTPSDGSSVSEPVGEILVMFTGVSEEAGDGFVVREADGRVREPVVSTFDGKTFRLTFDEPLSDGVVGVRWSVRAGDAHPIDGSFSFTIEAGASMAATSGAAAGTPPPVVDGEASSSAGDMAAMSPDEMATMGDFLEVDQSGPGETTATLGRLISLSGIVLAVGALAFAATTLRGARSEIDMLITAVRILGAAIVVGGIIEYVGVATILGDGLTSTWSSSPGLATVLRLVGGIAIALGLAATTETVERPTSPRSLSSAANRSTTDPFRADVRDERSTAPAVEALLDPGLTLTRRLASGNSTMRDVARGGPAVRGALGSPLRRWIPDRSSWLGLAGVAVAIVSFWFDGHTATRGFRPLHAVANSVHVVAGSVWVGGVIALATVIWSRHRRRQPSGALDLVVRFSSVASLALGAVVVAGFVMAVSILDSVGQLTSTPWGQTLLLKTAAATLAMLAGAYNHFRLMPALERDPGNAELHHTVRSVVTAEAILLGFVVIVTAWLVAAAT